MGCASVRNRRFSTALATTTIAAFTLSVAATAQAPRAVIQDDRDFGQPVPLGPNQQIDTERVVNLGPYGTKFVQKVRQTRPNPAFVIRLPNGSIISRTNGTDPDGNQITHSVTEVQQPDGSTRLQLTCTMTTPGGATKMIHTTAPAGSSLVGGSGREAKSGDEGGGPPWVQPPGTAVMSPAAAPVPPPEEAALSAAMGVPDTPAPQFWNVPSHILVYLVPGVGPSEVYLQFGMIGDMNCDGALSVADIGGFVLALTDPAGYHASFAGCDLLSADINSDRLISVTDIGLFVALLTGG